MILLERCSDGDRIVGLALAESNLQPEYIAMAIEVMRKTERLAAAARLTATMAHEINNPLQALVASRNTRMTPSNSPLSLRMGAALSSIGICVPSLRLSTV